MATEAAPAAPAAEPQYDIPKECKAAVIHDIGPNFTVKVEMVPVPEPGPGQLLLKLNATGICYSDVHFMLNDLGAPPMSFFGVKSPGHEGAGIVVKVGENVSGWKLGERAGIKPMWDTCQSCELCWNDKETYCEKVVHTGLMVTGSYQQYVLSPARYTTRIPDGIPDHLAAPVMCSASTMYRSLAESGLRPGDWAAFPGGGGGVGIQGVQLAKAMGFRPIVVDTGDAKQTMALEMGAEAFVDFKATEDVAKEVARIADGKGAHGVFVTAPNAYANAISLVGSRIGAKVMCIGLPPQEANCMLQIPPGQLISRNLTVKGTLVAGMGDTAKALEFAARGALKQICEVVPVDQFPEAIAKLMRGEVAGRMVIDFNA
ncbi:alcohol dehydrogenase [Eremomyces bilateralis CBS 781.70]|uniref:Alcohol dehydrogenase n=1 Tax=Eremomyces bilateralis CBS 781.70 TaxID=1392243 RepID=A0A6G1G409_9PEZI|nr:alcohol dehydrogenase [Eremomyces bilateralis CBS 781.70]KAF1812835.1 alcohol dehydrogenase [Eremomyces bilateralis CBS 781.70]